MSRFTDRLSSMSGSRALVVGAVTAGAFVVASVPAAHAAPLASTVAKPAQSQTTAKANTGLTSSLGLNLAGTNMYQGQKSSLNGMTSGMLGANINTMGGINLSSASTSKNGATTTSNAGANVGLGAGAVVDTQASSATKGDKATAASSTTAGVGAGLNVGAGASTTTGTSTGSDATDLGGLTGGNLLGGDVLNGGLLNLQ